MDKVYTNNFIIFQDDWNAVVGDCNDNWSNVVGRFTIGKSNQRGNRFLEFCTKNNIILTNTIYIYLHSHNGLTRNQIDKIVIPHSFK